MKKKPILCFAVFLLAFVFGTGIGVAAGFETEPVDTAKQEEVLSNRALAPVSEWSIPGAIVCFDVNADQQIAVGFETDMRETYESIIHVYDRNGTFLYGYSFTSFGSYYVDWDEDILNLYLVRSDLLIALDENGTCVSMERIHDTLENDAYWRSLNRHTEQTVGDETFQIRNKTRFQDLNWAKYSMLVRIDPDGQEVLLLECPLTGMSALMVIMAVVLGTLGIAVYLFVKFKKQPQE